MSGDEIRTRTRQAAAKYGDSLRDFLRLPPTRAARSSESADGAFFFDADQADKTAERIRKELPDEVEALARRCERLCRKRFDLLGYPDLDFGDPIDWSLDPVSGKRAPRRRWPWVPYLDFEIVGDHKVIWELSRCQHLLALARGWKITGRAEFLEEAWAQFGAWRDQNRYPWGVNWTSTLEVAFRAVSWAWMERLTRGQSKRPADLIDAIGESARYIERFLSTYFSPNTHLIGEAYGLYLIGAAYPQFQAAERWRRTGRRILLAEAERQIRPDGMHFEQSTYYHVYAVDFFLHFKVLAEKAGEPAPKAFDLTLERMCGLLADLAQGGTVPRFGDDDGGRLFDGTRNQSREMADPLATAAVLYEKPEWAAVAPLCEETLWLLGPKASGRHKSLGETSPPRSRRHDGGGLHVMASGEKSPRVLAVDAGPLGALSGGHGHADALSVAWSQGGREWLTDPGTCRYPAETPERDRFRGTAAHSTLMVDGLDQAEPAGSFAWRALPEATTELFASGRCADVFVGSHPGYERLSPRVRHRRTAVQFKDGLCFVRDQALGSGTRRLDVHWRPAAGFRLERVSDGEIALVDGDRRLRFVSPRSTLWRREIAEGEVSPAYGAKLGATVVQYAADATLPAEAGVFLLGSPAEDDPAATAAFAATPGAAARYDLELGEAKISVWSADADAWSLGGWKTDARLLCWRESASGRTLIAAGATRLEWRGEAFFASEKPVDLFECWSVEGVLQTRSSGPATARSTATLRKLEAVKVTS